MRENSETHPIPALKHGTMEQHYHPPIPALRPLEMSQKISPNSPPHSKNH